MKRKRVGGHERIRVSESRLMGSVGVPQWGRWWGVRGLWLEVEDPFLPGRLEKGVILFGGTIKQHMMETEKQTPLYL